MGTFDISVILQQLRDLLATCSQAEAARIDQNVYFCVSDLAAVSQMLKALQLHRPIFQRIDYRDAMKEQRSSWRTVTKLVDNATPRKSSTFGLGQLVQPLSKLRMPKGKRDATWLKRADRVRQYSNDVWDDGRGTNSGTDQNRLKQIKQDYVDPQLDMMILSRSPEHILG